VRVSRSAPFLGLAAKASAYPSLGYSICMCLCKAFDEKDLEVDAVSEVLRFVLSCETCVRFLYVKSSERSFGVCVFRVYRMSFTWGSWSVWGFCGERSVDRRRNGWEERRRLAVGVREERHLIFGKKSPDHLFWPYCAQQEQVVERILMERERVVRESFGSLNSGSAKGLCGKRIVCGKV